MQQECEDAMAQALGRELHEGEAKRAENQVRYQMRMTARRDPQAWSALSRDERLQQGAEAAVAAMRGDLLRKQRLVELKIGAHDKIENALNAATQQLPANASPKALLRTLSRLLAFDPQGGLPGVQSAETTAHAIANEAIGRLMPLWNSTHGFAHIFESAKGVSDLVHELFGEDSGNPAAKAGAKAWIDTMGELRERAIAAGKSIGELVDWHYPQNHSQSRVAAAGPDKWIADIMPLMDRDKYVNEDGSLYTDDQLRDFLQHAYDSIITDGQNKVRNGYSAERGSYDISAPRNALLQEASRQIFFKEADGYLNYTGQYGDRTLWPTLMGHLQRVSRDIAMLETMGPDPDGLFQHFNQRALTDSLRSHPESASAIQAEAKFNQTLYDFVAGHRDVVSTRIQDAFQAFRNFQTAAKLGRVVITALSDEAGMAATAFANRVPWAGSFMRELRYLSPFRRADREVARGAGLGINGLIGGLNRFAMEDLRMGEGRGATAAMRDFTGKLATWVLHASGAEAMWDARRRALGSVLMNYLGRWTREKEHFADIHEDDHGMLARKGVTEQDWQVWRRAQLEDWGFAGETPQVERSGIAPQDEPRNTADVSQLPALQPGYHRFFGTAPDTSGPRFLTQDVNAARSQTTGPNVRLRYVDVHERVLKHLGVTEKAKGGYGDFNAPEATTALMQEVPFTEPQTTTTATSVKNGALTPKSIWAIPDDKIDEVIQPQLDDIRAKAQRQMDDLDQREQQANEWIDKRTDNLSAWAKRQQRKIQKQIDANQGMAQGMAKRLVQMYDRIDAVSSYFRHLREHPELPASARMEGAQNARSRLALDQVKREAQGILQEASQYRGQLKRGDQEYFGREAWAINELLNGRGDEASTAHALDRLKGLIGKYGLDKVRGMGPRLDAASQLWDRANEYRPAFGQLRQAGVREGKALQTITQVRAEMQRLLRGEETTEATRQFQGELQQRQEELGEYLDRAQARITRIQQVRQRIEGGVQPAIDQARLGARRHAASMLLGHVLEETGMGVMDTGARERARLQGWMKPGTTGGELARSVLLFKSFAGAMMMKHWQRAAAMPGPGQRARYAATLIVSGMALGALAVQLRNLVSGKNPSTVAEPQFWGEALLRGGGLGFYGDFLYDQLNSRDMQLASALGGPLATSGQELWDITGGAAINASKGKRTDEGAKVLRFARSNVPLLNLWYTSAAFDHVLWNNMQEAASPGYLDRMQNKAFIQRGTTSYWDPHDLVPHQAPDFSRLWQPDLGERQIEAMKRQAGLE